MELFKAIVETEYEKIQKFNAVVSWFHSLRYKNILGVFRGLCQGKADDALKVVEVGCAHAKLYRLLDEHFRVDYVGIEIDPTNVETARTRYGYKANFSSIHDSATTALSRVGKVDAVVALEMLEHIPEHDVVRLIETVAAAEPRLFVWSVPVELGPAVWLKNMCSYVMRYDRQAEYTFLETFWAGLYQMDRLSRTAPGTRVLTGAGWLKQCDIT